MGYISILPGTIKISNEEYISKSIKTYLRFGFSEYASIIYAEEQFYDLCIRAAERRKSARYRK